MNEEPQATSSSDDPLTDLYRKYCPSMVRVDLKTADGILPRLQPSTSAMGGWSPRAT